MMVMTPGLSIRLQKKRIEPRPRRAYCPAMRWKNILLLLWLVPTLATAADQAKVIKVLPHFLDLQGRHALHPSLYERDAYQARLRQNPALRSALRFDIQWKDGGWKEAKLRLELRGSPAGSGGANSKPVVLEKTVPADGWLSNWSSITLGGEDYKKFGELVAWRLTLWNGDQQVGEQKSFLW